jgi:hypothetical protein
MSAEFFKVPKSEKSVSLWVHPEGRVLGSIFVRQQSLHHSGEETPAELFNQAETFVVIYRDDLDEYRFYSKSSIVRLEHQNYADTEPDSEAIDCELHMMDGSLMTGKICGAFPPDRRRLYDLLSKGDDAFIPLHMDNSVISLINKSYIIYAKSL